MDFDESDERHIRCLMFCRTGWSGIFGGKGGRGKRSRQPHPENADAVAEKKTANQLIQNRIAWKKEFQFSIIQIDETWY